MEIVVGRRRRKIRMEGYARVDVCVELPDRLCLFIKRGVQARISGRFCAWLLEREILF
jgi:hypothetical protein